VGFTVPGRNDGVRHEAAEGLLAGPSEYLLGLCIPADDKALLVHADHRAECGVDDQSRPAFALAQGSFGVKPFDGFESQGDQRGDRMAELLFLQHPGARRADMLVAEHPHELSVEADRNIQHGADPEGLEIAGGELTRARVASGVCGIDHALGKQFTEVFGKVGRLELNSRGVAVLRRFIEIFASD
jgi:hypothetical protein